MPIGEGKIAKLESNADNVTFLTHPHLRDTTTYPQSGLSRRATIKTAHMASIPKVAAQNSHWLNAAANMQPMIARMRSSTSSGIRRSIIGDTIDPRLQGPGLWLAGPNWD